jgi:antitoxin (DNA-binding transcriptional repressor) of toxin-antitoxin stability system
MIEFVSAQYAPDGNAMDAMQYMSVSGLGLSLAAAQDRAERGKQLTVTRDGEPVAGAASPRRSGVVRRPGGPVPRPPVALHATGPGRVGWRRAGRDGPFGAAGTGGITRAGPLAGTAARRYHLRVG